MWGRWLGYNPNYMKATDKKPIDDPAAPPVPGISGTVLHGAPAGFTRVQMTLTAEQVKELEAKGCIVKRLPDPGQA